MEALVERRRNVREQLTDVVGKVEDLLLIQQPPISELAYLLRKLREQSDTLTQINEKVEKSLTLTLSSYSRVFVF